VAGYAYNSSGTVQSFALARYTSSGSLDTTFGAGGKVTTDFAGLDDSAAGVVLQSDGKIVAAGTAHSSTSGDDFALARYLGASGATPSIALALNQSGLVAGRPATDGMRSPVAVFHQQSSWDLSDLNTRIPGDSDWTVIWGKGIPDSIAIPGGPLGLTSDTAPWVRVRPLAACRGRVRGAPDLSWRAVDPDGLSGADRGLGIP
jgi:uncharacterized delta-60 repeat protein